MKYLKHSLWLLMSIILTTSYAQSTSKLASIDTTAIFYKKNKLLPGQIKPWEDGMRTTGKAGTYEWWYFDSNLKDGSTLVIVFYTKSQFNLKGGLAPRVTFELTKPDGKVIKRSATADQNSFFASTDSCYVKVGSNIFKGNLNEYEIHLDMEGLKADISLTGNISSWRPGSGFMNFKKDKSTSFFAWLPAVPHGEVKGNINIDGTDNLISGVGYHDHNWGNSPMNKLIHHWYWGRARVGEYALIASYIVSEKTYDYDAQPILLLVKNGKVILDDFQKVKFSAEDVYIDSNTLKPVAGKLVYEYNDDNKHYKITFNRKRDIVNRRFLSGLKGLKRSLAKLSGFDGAYMRFTGEVTIEKFENNKVTETTTEKSGVWETMYFGKALKEEVTGR
ncbi:hypothetical protein [Pedobacter antarcticus]|uniref:hypothetical protein n=1 Tax=Pedobacter antarcticus TaxID=34086 RepID=UPI001C598547|nr:hypothetical protein [Pedobacter antarcticus]